jgi:hypothetical protein
MKLNAVAPAAAARNLRRELPEDDATFAVVSFIAGSPLISDLGSWRNQVSKSVIRLPRVIKKF